MESGDRYGLSASYSFSAGGLGQMKAVRGNLQAILQATHNLQQGVKRSDIGQQLGAIGKQAKAGISQTAQQLQQVASSTQTATADLKGLRGEFRALRAESRLIDFGSLSDPNQFKDAEKQVHTYIKALHGLEQQVSGTATAEREFSAALKRQKETAKTQLAIAAEQRKSAIASERVGVGQSFQASGQTVLTPLLSIGKEAITITSSFNDQMSQVKAVLDPKDWAMLDTIRQKSKDLGATTRFSASDAAGGFVLLAQAGYDVDKQMSAITGTLNLAAAGNLELNRATEITVSTLGQFQLEADRATHVSNVLAKAAAMGQIDVNDIGESLKYAGGSAKRANLSLEQTSALLALLSEGGMKGEMGGTGLGSLIDSLTAPNTAGAKAIQELGVQTKDASGNLLPFEQVLGDVQARISKLPTGKQNNLMSRIFGTVGSRAASILLPRFERFATTTQTIIDTADKGLGAAKDQATIMEADIGGSFRNFQSAMEGVFIEIGEVLVPIVKAATDNLSALLGMFISLPKPIKTAIVVSGMLTAGIAALAVVLGFAATGFFGFQQAAATSNVALLTMQRGLVPLTGFFEAGLAAFANTNPLTASLNVIRSGVSGLLAPLAGLTAGMEAVGAASFAFLVSPLGLAIASMTGLILILELATPKVSVLGTALGGLAAPLGFVLGLIKGFTAGVLEAFQPAGKALGQTFALPLQVVGEALTQMQAIFGRFVGQGEETGRLFAKAIMRPFQLAGGLIVQAWAGTVGSIQALLKPFADFVGWIGHQLVGNLAEASPGPTWLIRKLWAMTVKFIQTALSGLVGWSKSAGSAIASALTAVFPVVQGQVARFGGFLRQALTAVLPKVLTGLVAIVTLIGLSLPQIDRLQQSLLSVSKTLASAWDWTVGFILGKLDYLSIGVSALQKRVVQPLTKELQLLQRAFSGDAEKMGPAAPGEMLNPQDARAALSRQFVQFLPQLFTIGPRLDQLLIGGIIEPIKAQMDALGFALLTISSMPMGLIKVLEKAGSAAKIIGAAPPKLLHALEGIPQAIALGLPALVGAAIYTGFLKGIEQKIEPVVQSLLTHFFGVFGATVPESVKRYIEGFKKAYQDVSEFIRSLLETPPISWLANIAGIFALEELLRIPAALKQSKTLAGVLGVMGQAVGAVYQTLKAIAATALYVASLPVLGAWSVISEIATRIGQSIMRSLKSVPVLQKGLETLETAGSTQIKATVNPTALYSSFKTTLTPLFEAINQQIRSFLLRLPYGEYLLAFFEGMTFGLKQTVMLFEVLGASMLRFVPLLTRFFPAKQYTAVFSSFGAVAVAAATQTGSAFMQSGKAILTFLSYLNPLKFWSEYFTTKGFLQYGIKQITPIDLFIDLIMPERKIVREKLSALFSIPLREVGDAGSRELIGSFLHQISQLPLVGKVIARGMQGLLNTILKLVTLGGFAGIEIRNLPIVGVWGQLRIMLPIVAQLVGRMALSWLNLYILLKPLDDELLNQIANLKIFRGQVAGLNNAFPILSGVLRGLRMAIVGPVDLFITLSQTVLPLVALGLFRTIQIVSRLTGFLLSLGGRVRESFAGIGFVIRGLALPFQATRESISDFIMVIETGDGIKIPNWAVSLLVFLGRFQDALGGIAAALQAIRVPEGLNVLGAMFGSLVEWLQGGVLAVLSLVFALSLFKTKNPLKSLLDTILVIPKAIGTAIRTAGFLRTELTKQGVDDLKHQIERQSLNLRFNLLLPEYERKIQEEQLSRRKDVQAFRDGMDQIAAKSLSKAGVAAEGDKGLLGKRAYSEAQLQQGRTAVFADDRSLRGAAMASGVASFADMAKNNQLDRLRLLDQEGKTKQYIEAGMLTSRVMNVQADQVNVGGKAADRLAQAVQAPEESPRAIAQRQIQGMSTTQMASPQAQEVNNLKFVAQLSEQRYGEVQALLGQTADELRGLNVPQLRQIAGLLKLEADNLSEVRPLVEAITARQDDLRQATGEYEVLIDSITKERRLEMESLANLEAMTAQTPRQNFFTKLFGGFQGLTQRFGQLFHKRVDQTEDQLQSDLAKAGLRRARMRQIMSATAPNLSPEEVTRKQNERSLLQQFVDTSPARRAEMPRPDLEQIYRLALGQTPAQSLPIEQITGALQSQINKVLERQAQIVGQLEGGIETIVNSTNIQFKSGVIEALKKGDMEALRADELRKTSRASGIPLAQLLDPRKAIRGRKDARSAQPLRSAMLAQMMQSAGIQTEMDLLKQAVQTAPGDIARLPVSELQRQMALLKRGEFTRMNQKFLDAIAATLKVAEGTRQEMGVAMEKMLSSQTLLENQQAPGLVKRLRQQMGQLFETVSPMRMLDRFQYQTGRSEAIKQVQETLRADAERRSQRESGLKEILLDKGRTPEDLKTRFSSFLQGNSYQKMYDDLVSGRLEALDERTVDTLKQWLGLSFKDLQQLEKFAPTSEPPPPRVEQMKVWLSDKQSELSETVRTVTGRLANQAKVAIGTQYQAMLATVEASEKTPQWAKRLMAVPGQAANANQQLQAQRSAYNANRAFSLPQIMKSQQLSFTDLRLDLEGEGLNLSEIEQVLKGQVKNLSNEATEAVLRVFEIPQSSKQQFQEQFTVGVIAPFPVILGKRLAVAAKNQVTRAAQFLGTTGLNLAVAQVGPKVNRLLGVQAQEFGFAAGGLVGAVRRIFPRSGLLQRLEARLIQSGQNLGQFFEAQADLAATLNVGPVANLQRAAQATTAVFNRVVTLFGSALQQIGQAVTAASSKGRTIAGQLFTTLGSTLQNVFTGFRDIFRKVGERSRRENQVRALTSQIEVERSQVPSRFQEMVSQSQRLATLEAERLQVQQQLQKQQVNATKDSIQLLKAQTKPMLQGFRQGLTRSLQAIGQFFSTSSDRLQARRPRAVAIERQQKMPRYQEVDGITSVSRDFLGREQFERGQRQTQVEMVVPPREAITARAVNTAKRLSGAIGASFLRAAKDSETAWALSATHVQEKSWKGMVRRAWWTGRKILGFISEASPGPSAQIRANYDHTADAVGGSMHEMAHHAHVTGDKIEHSMATAAKHSMGFLARLRGGLGKVGGAGLAVGGAVGAAGFAAQSVVSSLSSLGIVDEKTSAVFSKLFELVSIFGAIGSVAGPVLGAIVSSLGAILTVGSAVVTAVFSPLGLTIGAIVVGVLLLNTAVKRLFGVDILGSVVNRVKTALAAPLVGIVDDIQAKWQGLVKRFGPILNPIIQPAIATGKKLVGALSENSPGPTWQIRQHWGTTTDSLTEAMGTLPPSAKVAGDQAAQNLTGALSDARIGDLAFQVPPMPTPLLAFGSVEEKGLEVAALGKTIGKKVTGLTGHLKTFAQSVTPILTLHGKVQALLNPPAADSTSMVTSSTARINPMTGKPMEAVKPTFTVKEQLQQKIAPVVAPIMGAVTSIAASPLLPIVVGVTALIAAIEVLTPNLNVVGTLIGILVTPIAFIYGVLKGIIDRLRTVPVVANAIGKVAQKVSYLGDTLHTITRILGDAELAGEFVGDSIGLSLTNAAHWIKGAWQGLVDWFLQMPLAQFAANLGQELINRLNHSPTVVIPASWQGEIARIQHAMFGWLGSGKEVSEGLKESFNPVDWLGDLVSGKVSLSGLWKPIQKEQKQAVAEMMQPIKLDQSNVLTEAIQRAKLAGQHRAVDELSWQMASTGGQLTPPQIAQLQASPTTGSFMQKAQSKVNAQAEVQESVAATKAAINGGLETLSMEWSDRMSYLRSTGIVDVGQLFAPGMDEATQGFQRLGGDIGTFGQEAAIALLHLDFDGLGHAATAFGENVWQASKEIIHGFSSMSLSSVAFGVYSLLSLSPVTLILAGIGLAVLGLATNFLGLRNILVGGFKVIFGLLQTAIALVRGFGQIFQGIGTLISGVLKAITGDFSQLQLGVSQIFTGIRTLYTGVGEGLRHVWSGAIQMIRGAFQGFWQVARTILKAFGLGVGQIKEQFSRVSNGVRLLGQGLLTVLTKPQAVWQKFLDLVERIQSGVKGVVGAIGDSTVGRLTKAVQLRTTGQAGSLKSAQDMVAFDQQLKGKPEGTKKPGFFSKFFGGQQSKELTNFDQRLAGSEPEAKLTVGDRAGLTRRAAGQAVNRIGGQFFRQKPKPEKPAANTAAQDTSDVLLTVSGALGLFAPAIAAPIAAVSTLMDTFTSLSGTLPSLLKFFGSAIASITATGGVSSLLGGINLFLSTTFASLGTAASRAWLAVSGPLLPIIAIVGLVALTIAGLYFAFKHNFMGISDSFGGLWESLKGLGSSLLQILNPVIQILRLIGAAILGVLIVPLKLVFGLLNTMVHTISAVIQGLASLVTGVTGLVGGAFQALYNLIPSPIRWLLEMAAQGVGWALGAIVNTAAPVQQFAAGGFVSGAGTGTSDSIPAMLSNGEYVMPANATQRNLGVLEAMRSGLDPLALLKAIPQLLPLPLPPIPTPLLAPVGAGNAGTNNNTPIQVSISVGDIILSGASGVEAADEFLEAIETKIKSRLPYWLRELVESSRG